MTSFEHKLNCDQLSKHKTVIVSLGYYKYPQYTETMGNFTF